MTDILEAQHLLQELARDSSLFLTPLVSNSVVYSSCIVKEDLTTYIKEDSLRADRLLSILLLLQARGRMTARELAERLEVSERTIYRDLDALSTVGVPIYAERGPGGGCELLNGYQTKLNGLTEMEVRALFLLSVSGPLVDLGLGKALEDALLKLSTALPAPYRSNAELVRQCIHLDTAPSYSSEMRVPYLHIIQDALWQDRKLHLTYSSGNSHSIEQLVDPYGLVARARTWYLVGAVAGRVQVFRVSHLQAVVMAQECFERPGAFDLAAYWAEREQELEANRLRNTERTKRNHIGAIKKTKNAGAQQQKKRLPTPTYRSTNKKKDLNSSPIRSHNKKKKFSRFCVSPEIKKTIIYIPPLFRCSALSVA